MTKERFGACRIPALCRLILAALVLITAGNSGAATPLALVAEMERPEGIVGARPSARRALAGHPGIEPGLAAFRSRLHAIWPEIRDLDLLALSRYHREATRGWRLPDRPGELTGRVIGADPDGSALYLELRGPRLPASFDIVHRHLTFYARYRPADGSLDRLTASIRLEVFE